MIALSRVQFDTIYQRLGVKFDHTLGESFYHPRLQPLVEELRAKGIARESEGALGRLLRGHSAIEGTPRPDSKERRRLQLHHHRPGHPGAPAGNLAPRRDRLCHRCPPAAPFPATLRRVPPLASRGQSETGPCLVRLHPGRGRQALQNPLRRNHQTVRPAGRGRGARVQGRVGEEPGTAGSRSGAKSPASSASARSNTPTCCPTARAITCSVGTSCWR